MKSMVSVLGCATYVVLAMHDIGHGNPVGAHYKVLSPVSQDKLTVFPVVADVIFDTSEFLTLDEGIRSGRVVITEATSQLNGLVRPRPHSSMDDGIWSERPNIYPQQGARVNELALLNNSDRPLLLLAGEIVTGGKQDRVVGADRIIPAHAKPIALGVFCVEPHRWNETSAQFGALPFSMAQPSVRSKAMAAQNQQTVWDEVAKSRASFAAKLAMPQARAVESTSSYAAAMQRDGVRHQLDSLSAPVEQRFDKLRQQLRAEKAVGAIAAINGELIWVDVFASPSLFDKYWPKLIRSYAAEALNPHVSPVVYKLPPTLDSAQQFLERFDARHESVSTEPGLYRNTEITGDDFHAFILTALLPNTGFTIHMAKMKQ